MQDIRKEFLSFRELVTFGLDIVKEYWKAFLSIGLGLFLVNIIITFIQTSLIGFGIEDLTNAMQTYTGYGAMSRTSSTGVILFGSLLTFAQYFISFLAIFAVVYLVKCFFENREFSFDEMFSFAGTRIKGYLTTSLLMFFIVLGIIILMSIVFVILTALSTLNSIFSILLVLGIFGFCAFLVVFELKYIFIYHAIGFFNKSGKEAFKLSAHLTKGYKFKIFARQFCLSIVYGIIIIILGAIPIIGTIVTSFLSLFSYIFLAVMFLNLFYLNREEDGNEEDDFGEEYSN